MKYEDPVNSEITFEHEIHVLMLQLDKIKRRMKTNAAQLKKICDENLAYVKQIEKITEAMEQLTKTIQIITAR